MIFSEIQWKVVLFLAPNAGLCTVLKKKTTTLNRFSVNNLFNSYYTIVNMESWLEWVLSLLNLILAPPTHTDVINVYQPSAVACAGWQGRACRMAEGRPGTQRGTQTHWQIDPAGVALNALSGLCTCLVWVKERDLAFHSSWWCYSVNMSCELCAMSQNICQEAQADFSSC